MAHLPCLYFILLLFIILYIILELSETAKKDHSSPDAFKFILDEFNTQYLIGTYNKPVVALAHGYCMGGVSI